MSELYLDRPTTGRWLSTKKLLQTTTDHHRQWNVRIVTWGLPIVTFGARGYFSSSSVGLDLLDVASFVDCDVVWCSAGGESWVEHWLFCSLPSLPHTMPTHRAVMITSYILTDFIMFNFCAVQLWDVRECIKTTRYLASRPVDRKMIKRLSSYISDSGVFCLRKMSKVFFENASLFWLTQSRTQNWDVWSILVCERSISSFTAVWRQRIRPDCQSVNVAISNAVMALLGLGIQCVAMRALFFDSVANQRVTLDSSVQFVYLFYL